MFNSYVKVPEGISNIYHGSQDPCLLLNHPNEPNISGGWFGDDPTTDTLP